jgi:phosphatidylethanolamine-binding protein (PEBP) family uncharacterized protein
MNKRIKLFATLLFFGTIAGQPAASASQLTYGCSKPPLEATFQVTGGHYNGAVSCGNIFLQNDIPTAPVVRWVAAKAKKLYMLLMIDFDGNAEGSWPDAVLPGSNAPVRHWIVGNIPGAMLSGTGYVESDGPADKTISLVQPYRAPHIPEVSDRYGAYLFEQPTRIDYATLPDPVTNFNCYGFLDQYKLGTPVASNWFVAVYTSESPFSGKDFHGNPVTKTWHKGLGHGGLVEGH